MLPLLAANGLYTPTQTLFSYTFAEMSESVSSRIGSMLRTPMANFRFEGRYGSMPLDTDQAE